MQVTISMKAKKHFFVPFNYNYQLQSAIYGKLREINGSDFWHDQGFGDFRKFKGFTFGALKGRYTVRDNKIHFEENVSFEVRSPLFEFCDDFQRAVEYFPVFRLFDTELEVISVHTENRHINLSHTVFDAQTPIVIRKTCGGYTQYFSPDDEEFFRGICSNFKNKYQSIFRMSAGELKVRPVGEYKKVVTNYKNTWITGYRGKIDVQASVSALEFMYNAGIGVKTSQGFGFADI